VLKLQVLRIRMSTYGRLTCGKCQPVHLLGMLFQTVPKLAHKPIFCLYIWSLYAISNNYTFVLLAPSTFAVFFTVDMLYKIVIYADITWDGVENCWLSVDTQLLLGAPDNQLTQFHLQRKPDSYFYTSQGGGSQVYTGCGKKWTLKFFAVFLATIWNFNNKFYSFIWRNLLHLIA